MVAVEIVPRSEVDLNRERRHCPECGQVYECKAHWRQRMCPACNGRRIAQAAAQRGVGKPPARPNAPAEPTTAPSLEAPMPPSLPVLAAPATLETELGVLRAAAITLDDLDPQTRKRIMAWLWARYGEQ